MISPITALSSASYSIVSVYGNPRTLRPIDAVRRDTARTAPLITARENIKTEPDVYVWKDDRERDNGIASGGFADIMEMQDRVYGESHDSVGSTVNLNDIMNDMMLGVSRYIPSAG